IFANLLMNAKDAMDEVGEVTIGIERVDSNELGQLVMLSVRDTGRGIPESDFAKIFDPFFTTKEFGAGSGLGLSVVEGVVAQAGGNIELESEIGKGTCFKIFVPFKKISDHLGKVQDEGDVPVDGTGVTILYAEDEEGLREVTTDILGMSG